MAFLACCVGMPLLPLDMIITSEIEKLQSKFATTALCAMVQLGGKPSGTMITI
jgi:hypothetical protein